MRRVPDDVPFALPRGSLAFRLLVGAFILVAILASSAGFYVDMLWFESLGFLNVFWYGFQARGAAFAVFFVATTALLWTAFRILLAVAGASRRAFIQIQGRIVDAPSVETMKRIGTAAAVALGILFGLLFSSPWETYALYWNQAQAGAADPIYGRPVSFYLFTLPVLEWVVRWWIGVSVIVMAAAVGLVVVGLTVTLRGASVAGTLLALGVSARLILARYQLLLADHNLFSGVRYVDDAALGKGLLVVAAALLASALILLLNRQGKIRNIALAVILPAGAYVIGVVLIPWYVSTFIVRPNELARETPYIRHNIEATRSAYDLDDVEMVAYEPRQTGVGFDATEHQATLDSLRLWDWKALQDTLGQLQEIRTYYDFADVDIDRYTVDGKLTAMMVAPREIDISKLPAGSRNWVNDRLTYTHGYGVTMNSASRFTRDGLPEFVLSDMPVRSSSPELQIKRPEIYFGELTNWPVYVKTQQKEFNYPEGDANNYSNYEGSGGIRMGGFFRRLLLALQVGDILTVPFSKDVTSDSALMLHRNITERASRIAPFLRYDEDPYIVVGDDGALYWILDGYTTSDRYPYSRPIGLDRGSINYIRNSVKAVIDAYNGSVTFYIFDEEDPLLSSYRRMFPDLFKPRTMMPDMLARHVRYPELLFQVQGMVYSAYHVDNEQVFYNREDVWSIAQEARAQEGRPDGGIVEPLFSLMRFPGETSTEFVSIIPFTPARRNNMIGWIAGRSDGEHYGKLRAYHLPKTRLIDGPLQIEARIDQDPQLSSQLSLWNQQGSVVIRGNLLVIPIEDTLLFAEPIYLQAQRSPMPALRLIVLATQDRLAYATTFDEALKLLLSGGGGSLSQPLSQPLAPVQSQNQPPGATPTATAPASAQDLAARANQALAEYRRLTAEGRMAEAGARLDELRTLLERLNSGNGR